LLERLIESPSDRNLCASTAESLMGDELLVGDAAAFGLQFEREDAPRVDDDEVRHAREAADLFEDRRSAARENSVVSFESTFARSCIVMNCALYRGRLVKPYPLYRD
jgi:hypothetical protein